MAFAFTFSQIPFGNIGIHLFSLTARNVNQGKMEFLELVGNQSKNKSTPNSEEVRRGVNKPVP